MTRSEFKCETVEEKYELARQLLLSGNQRAPRRLQQSPLYRVDLESREEKVHECVAAKAVGKPFLPHTIPAKLEYRPPVHP